MTTHNEVPAVVDFITEIEGKEVTVLCSGKSADSHLDNNDVVIVPNRSIMLPQVLNYKTIIWVKGTGWKRSNVVSWWKEIAQQIEFNPHYMLVRYQGGADEEYLKFESEFTKILPYTKILPISLSLTASGPISTGMRCIELALESSASKIVVAGMEMGVDTKYSNLLQQKEVILKKGNDSFTNHLSSDIEFYKNLDTQKSNRIIPVENSGFNHFLKKGEVG